MNLKHLFLTTAIIAIIFSCKKSDPEPTIKNEEDLEVVNSTSFEKIEMKVSQEIKAEPYFMVGYGYDAKENLLFVNKGLRAKILDTKKLSEADKISKMKGASSGGTFIEDLSKSRLLHNLMLNSNFNMEKLTTTETEVLSNIPESDRDIQLKHYYTDFTIGLINPMLKTRNFSMKNLSILLRPTVLQISLKNMAHTLYLLVQKEHR